MFLWDCKLNYECSVYFHLLKLSLYKVLGIPLRIDFCSSSLKSNINGNLSAVQSQYGNNMIFREHTGNIRSHTHFESSSKSI